MHARTLAHMTNKHVLIAFHRFRNVFELIGVYAGMDIVHGHENLVVRSTSTISRVLVQIIVSIRYALSGFTQDMRES